MTFSLSLVHCSVHEDSFRVPVQERLSKGRRLDGRGTATQKRGPQDWREVRFDALGAAAADLLYFGGHGDVDRKGMLLQPNVLGPGGEMEEVLDQWLSEVMPATLTARLIYFDSCFQAKQLDPLSARFPDTLMFAQCGVSNYEAGTNNARVLADSMQLLHDERGALPDDPAALRAELGRVSGRGHDPLPDQHARQTNALCGHWSAGTHRARPANGTFQPNRADCLRDADWDLPAS